jgi:hypothetical protein
MAGPEASNSKKRALTGVKTCVCTAKCVYDGIRYFEGETITVPDTEKAPDHFADVPDGDAGE